MSDEEKEVTLDEEEARKIHKEALELAKDNEMKEEFDNFLKLISSIASDETAMETLRKQIINHYGE